TLARMLSCTCSGAQRRDAYARATPPPTPAATPEKRRAAVEVAAVIPLVAPGGASATSAQDATLARRGIAHAVKQRWVKPADAQRYRASVTRALTDISRLPRLRADVIASQLSQVAPFSSSYTSPRALALFSQLEMNLSYFETNPLPSTRLDVAGDAGL